MSEEYLEDGEIEETAKNIFDEMRLVDWRIWYIDLHASSETCYLVVNIPGQKPWRFKIAVGPLYKMRESIRRRVIEKLESMRLNPPNSPSGSEHN